MDTQASRCEAWVRGVLGAVDAGDVDAFCEHLAEDVVFTFGNAPAVHGRDATRETVAGFLGMLGGIAHRLEAAWASDGAVFGHGDVTYTRGDGSELTVPFAVVWYLDGDRIRDYRILADVSAL